MPASHFSNIAAAHDISTTPELVRFEEAMRVCSQKRDVYEQYIHQYDRHWRHRGVSQVEFCSWYGVPVERMRAWRSYLKSRGEYSEVSAAEPDREISFVEVKVKSTAGELPVTRCAEWPIVIKLAGSEHQVVVGEGASELLLGRLLRALVSS